MRHVTKRQKIWAASGLAGLAVLWLLAGVFWLKISVGPARVPAHSDDTALLSTISQQLSTYKLTVAYPGGKAGRFSLAQMGLSLDPNSSLRATRDQQHRFGHRLAWWQPVRAVVVLHEDKAAFNNFISQHINVTVQPSLDASLSISNGNIVLTNAVTGKQYGLKEPEHTLLAAAGSLQTAPLRLQTLKIDPALTSSILAPYKDQLEKTMNQPAKFVVGSQVVKPTPAQIASWLDITPDDKSKKVDIAVNSGKVAAYINSIAASAIHPARDEVDLTEADGSTQVFIAGVNGIDVINKSGVATEVAANLLSGGGFSYSLPVRTTPFQVVKTGSYPKWIEVDLTNKKLYAYEYTNLVNTFLVSAGAPATPTVTGQYSIYAKYDQQDMQGENVDGSSYFQPHVPWVNYFYKDYAIHGNYWRPLSYFGNINSSHGCVGLIDDQAEWIYDWAPIGTPVVVHT